jgi:gas vesicle protein
MSDLPEIPKKKRRLGGIIATLVIGGAIGSVVGMSLAPQSGKKTREDLKKKGEKILQEGKRFIDEHEDEIAGLKQSGSSLLSEIFKTLRK